jgi:hypothetical protein
VREAKRVLQPGYVRVEHDPLWVKDGNINTSVRTRAD